MSETTVTAVETTSVETSTEPAETTAKPTETVEFWKAKAREQEKRAKENADAAKRLADIEAAQLSDQEKANRRIAELESQLAERDLTALRQRVAIEKGLPASLVDRLQGQTEDELSADADELLGLVANRPASPRPDPSQGARGGDTQSLNGDGLEQALRMKLGI